MTAVERLAAFEAGHKAARLKGIGGELPLNLNAEQRDWWFRGNTLSKAGGHEQYTQLRRMRMEVAQERGTHTFAEWDELQKRYGHRCAICGEKAERLHRDHILAISRGGSDAIDNIQPACPRCNSVKGPRKSESVKIAPTSRDPRDSLPGEKNPLIERHPWPSRLDLVAVPYARDEKEKNLWYRHGHAYARFRVSQTDVNVYLNGCLPRVARRKVRKVREQLAVFRRENETSCQSRMTVQTFISELLAKG